MAGETMESMNQARNEAQRKYDRETKRQRVDQMRQTAMSMAIESLRGGSSTTANLKDRAHAIFNFLKGDSV